ncbi:hypothetical protein SDC9_193754 [bioreactor metagenome]|uniref:Uncharacterized protein n=1 Tax=bioreactor metagenome TaxID=1076179 RepID=A0A645I4F6_9ZZZZ
MDAILFTADFAVCVILLPAVFTVWIAFDVKDLAALPTLLDILLIKLFDFEGLLELLALLLLLPELFEAGAE